MSITIDTSGHISIDGKDTGLGVSQQSKGTVLYQREITPASARSLGCSPVEYRVIALPRTRYSLAHAKPASGNPGLMQFEADVRAVLAR